MLRRSLALCVLLLTAFAAFAQSGDSAPGQEAQWAMSELERKTLALDIAVSNYYELRAMAGRYGLSTEGSSEELRAGLYRYFGLEPPEHPAPASSVTIESASSVEYFSLEGSEERLIRLLGPIAMTITTDDGYSHKVSADEIVFNREKNIVQAAGDVLYIREGGGRSDEFSGSSIIIDLNSYSGVFLDGAYNLEPTASTQRTFSFRFDELTKRGPDVSILERASVTACDELPPHYHIRARKVWLFENGDWALSDATLYLGIVPVLWLPFFYYPSDEILFHPVFGYRSREGAFVQTTTYLLGEKPKGTETSSSLSLFSQEENGVAREVSGIFIRRTQSDGETEKKTAGDASPGASLKLLADIYSSLGLYVGLAGERPDTKAGALDFSLGLGLSRSLFLESNGYYSPFDASNDYASAWNASNFLGLDLPFRFGLEAGYAYKKSTGPLKYSIAFEVPLYSDPYFEQDFFQRKESSTLLSALETNTTAVSKRTSMTQSAKASLSWAAPRSKSATFLESAEISKLSSQMAWKSKSQPTAGLTAIEKRLLSVDPQRDFFYPDSLKALDGSFSFSGTIIRYDTKSQGASGSGAVSAAEAAPAPAAAPTSESASGEAGRDFSRFVADLGWSASGSANVEEKFRSSAWLYPDDVDGSLSYLLVGWKGSGKLTSSANWAEKLLSLQTSLGFGSQDQWRPYLFDDRTSPVSVHPYKLSDYSYRSSALDASAALSFSPFETQSPWSASALRYSIGGTIFKNKYAGLSGSGLDAAPTYDSTWIGWDSETLSTHSLAATFSLAPKNNPSQRLGFSMALPPLLEKYSATYSLTSKYFKTSLLGSLSRASEEAEILPASLSAQIVLGASPYPVLKSDFSWDFKEGAPLSSVTSLEYGWAKTAFAAKKSKGYVFSDGLWSADGTEGFKPYEFSLSLSPRIGEASGKAAGGSATKGSGLRLDLRPTLSYTQNLVRFTESTLGATLNLALTSAAGTSLSFSSVSANKSAWRYWPSLFPATAGFDPADYSRDFFGDLADSLSIWDRTALKRSLFKLQNLSLKLSQDLHDWNLEAALAMSPVLFTPDSGRPYYELDFSFSMAVTWKDIPELKTSVAYEDGGFER